MDARERFSVKLRRTPFVDVNNLIATAEERTTAGISRYILEKCNDNCNYYIRAQDKCRTVLSLGLDKYYMKKVVFYLVYNGQVL